MKKRGLFGPARHEWIAEIITFQSVAGAQGAVNRLLTYMKQGRKGGLRIGPARALAIARALRLAANRARASAKRKGLSNAEKRKLQRIAGIYERGAKRAFEIYGKKYRGVGR